jgi:hypothetical protein
MSDGIELVDVARFRGKVAINAESGCWHWTGRIDRDGYGTHEIHRDRVRYYFSSHRLAYRLWVGEIPAGLQIDHVCHSEDRDCGGGVSCLHRRCINPAHLEVVTPSENTRRGRNIGRGKVRKRIVTESGVEVAVCKNGHLMTPENSKPHSKWPTSVVCVQCGRDHQQRRQQRNRAPRPEN